MKTDAQLKNDVMEELRWEPTVTSSNISVAAHDGVVTLSGSVPHYAEKRAAERATQRVAGVNHMTTGSTNINPIIRHVLTGGVR